uniref:Uncharacterized protein n=2 Tax=Parascaris TaxID=6254 RepID=A0A915BGQ7_PARUN
MRVSVNTVIAFLLTVVFLSYIPGFYIYLYFTRIAFQSFNEPFEFTTLFIEFIKRSAALIACTIAIIIYSDMAFPFVLACFGKILQSAGVEVDEDASVVQRKKETLLRIQDRSRCLDDRQEISSQLAASEQERNSPSSLDVSFECQQEQINDEAFRERMKLISLTDNAHIESVSEFFCGRDLSICTSVVQSR